MRFTRFNKTIILFIAISIAIHLCLLGIFLINGSLNLSGENPVRMKITLQSYSEATSANTKTISSADDSKKDQATKKDTGTSNPPKLEAQESPPTHTGGWGVGKTPANLHAASVSERSALQSRINMERQQKLSTISSNVAQLVGRLNQEAIVVSCALLLSQDTRNGYLKCTPEQFKGQIQFGLSPSNIHWVNNQTELEPAPMCIPIQIRNAQPAC
jgi:preprotein translocase subunit SecF